MIAKPLDVPGLADLLSVSTSWVYRRVEAGLLPHARLGNHIRFTEDHVRQILAGGDATVVPARVYSIADARRRIA